MLLYEIKERPKLSFTVELTPQLRRANTPILGLNFWLKRQKGEMEILTIITQRL